MYHISSSVDGIEYEANRRFSDFVQLKKDLEDLNHISLPYPLPAKVNVFSRKDAITQQRSEALNEFLQNIVYDPHWRNNDIFKRFLSIPLSSLTKIVIPEEKDVEKTGYAEGDWILLLRSYNSLMQRCRSGLLNNNGNTSESRILLVKSEKLLNTIRESLVQDGSMGEGEFARRQRLLSAAQADYDDLNKLLRNAAVENKSEKVNLFSQRRVLGAPKETDVTKPLDNKQLLQLQQEQIQRQDQDVLEIAEIIRRQKEIGITINKELAEQNEMLDELNDDVDNSEEKMRIVRKRANKVL